LLLKVIETAEPEKDFRKWQSGIGNSVVQKVDTHLIGTVTTVEKGPIKVTATKRRGKAGATATRSVDAVTRPKYALFIWYMPPR